MKVTSSHRCSFYSCLAKSDKSMERKTNENLDIFDFSTYATFIITSTNVTKISGELSIDKDGTFSRLYVQQNFHYSNILLRKRHFFKDHFSPFCHLPE